MQKKENQRIALTKQLIKNALMELMERKPIDKISISELCSVAEINRTTFYHHYGSQYDVLNEIGTQMIQTLITISTQHNETTGWMLDRQVEEICNYLKAHQKEAKLLLTNFSAESEPIQRLFQQRITSQTQYQAFIAHYDEMTQTLLNTFMMHGIYSLIRQWLLEDMPQSPKEIGALALDVAQSGWMKKV